MKKVRLQLICIALTLLFFGGQVTSNEAAQAQTNLLQNPGFEFPYHDDGAATGWVRWHRNSSEDQFSDCANGYHKLPHWTPETASAQFIHSGSVSQHIGNNWDTWAAGVWQNVSVTPGTTYRFTVHAKGRGSNDPVPAPSEAGLRMDIRVGIDPNGSGLWSDSDVVWSGTINPHDQWQPLSIQATATGDKVTVFTAADWGLEGVNQCRLFLDVWFDTAELVAAAPPPTNTPPPAPTQPPPPPVTNTPVPPTNTATPEVTPTETAVPTDTPSPVPTTPPGGTVCVNAFADDNANGLHDDDEGYMGNVTFTLASDNQVVGQAVSSGSDNPVCFDGLDPGAYEIAQNVPGRLEMTTAAGATITVEEGKTVGVEFGSRIRANASADTETASADTVASVVTPAGVDDVDIEESVATANSGLSLPALSGLIVLIVAVVLLGMLIFLVLRRAT